MKKILSIAVVALLAIGSFSSCKKCGHCEGGSYSSTSKVCDGNVVEDAFYSASETTCTAGGGTWKKD